MVGYFIVAAFLLLGIVSIWQAKQLKKGGEVEKYKASMGIGVIFCILAIVNVVLIATHII